MKGLGRLQKIPYIKNHTSKPSQYGLSLFPFKTLQHNMNRVPGTLEDFNEKKG